MQKKKFTTTLDDELVKQIKIIAVEKDESVSSILEILIKNYVAEVKVVKHDALI